MEIKELSVELSTQMQELVDFQAYMEQAFQIYFNELFGAKIVLNDQNKKAGH